MSAVTFVLYAVLAAENCGLYPRIALIPTNGMTDLRQERSYDYVLFYV
jgi:hypothetical protein